MESEDLQACREALELKGFSPDLATYELGPSKMFVGADAAEATLQALHRRCQEKKKKKKKTCTRRTVPPRRSVSRRRCLGQESAPQER